MKTNKWLVINYPGGQDHCRIKSAREANTIIENYKNRFGGNITWKIQ